MAVDNTKINVRPIQGQTDFSNVPHDYGKNIVNPLVQDEFLNFLNQKAVPYDKRLDSEWWGKAEETSNESEKVQIRKAGCDHGSVLCDQELGTMYASGSTYVPKDLEKAKVHLLRAAKCGLPSAMYFLGLVYMKDEDLVFEALDWICKAAIRGDITAYKSLNECAKNYTVKVQIEDRLSVYFRTICDKEEPNGKENRFLGFCYYAGLCCIPNLDFAELHWLAAKEQGDIYVSLLLENPSIIGDAAEQVVQANKLYHNDILSTEANQKSLEGKKEGSKVLPVISLIIGIVCMFMNFGLFPSILSVIGIILGIKGRQIGGKGIATTGIVINGFVLLVSVLTKLCLLW